MRLTGRRESTNVDDRRGVHLSGKAGAGMGIGGIILVAIISLIMVVILWICYNNSVPRI